MHLYREVVRRRFEGASNEGGNGDGALTFPAFHFLDFVAFGASVAYTFYEDACALLESALLSVRHCKGPPYIVQAGYCANT